MQGQTDGEWLMSWAKRKEEISSFGRLIARLTGTSHLPDPKRVCESCGRKGHVTCWDAVTADSTSDVSPLIALHDAALRMEREAA